MASAMSSDRPLTTLWPCQGSACPRVRRHHRRGPLRPAASFDHRGCVSRREATPRRRFPTSPTATPGAGVKGRRRRARTRSGAEARSVPLRPVEGVAPPPAEHRRPQVPTPMSSRAAGCIDWFYIEDARWLTLEPVLPPPTTDTSLGHPSVSLAPPAPTEFADVPGEDDEAHHT